MLQHGHLDSKRGGGKRVNTVYRATIRGPVLVEIPRVVNGEALLIAALI